MMIMIDNYDSFFYNIVRYFEELGERILVFRNDKITINNIKKLKPNGIILSPGPCTPFEAGISMQIVECLKGSLPILGVCLGLQTIAQVFNAKIVEAKEPVHGKISTIVHDNRGLFKGVKSPLNVTRYHSLIIDNDVPDCLEVSARSLDGTIMGLRHKEYKIEGVQFHPEAHLTECGHDLFQNFIEFCTER
ncbi:MAG: aminodeoxychorismate/anthranilate synthase component II [Spirochaetales bacterium]|nr:aminodeoxychorismate/anthranilate synthase component II [Spirochaetales bacterium]